MRAPDAPRQELGPRAPLTHQCQNPQCSTTFAHRRRGGNKFCSDECRWGADDNARHVLRRIRFTRELIGQSTRTLLALHSTLESLPDTQASRRYHLSEQLQQLDLLLSKRGPNDLAVRSYVSVQAAAIRLSFEREMPASLEGLRQYIRALEILRDVGVEHQKETGKLREYGWAAVEFYRSTHDLANLSAALQAFANTCRLDQDEVMARRITRRAWRILHEKFGRSDDPKVLRLAHQSAFWDLRLFQENITERAAQEKREQIVRLAERLDTASVWLETRRELAGYWSMRGEFDEAHRQLGALEDLQNITPSLPTYGAPTLLRPKIECLFGTGKPSDRDQAIHMIEKDYADLYRQDPHDYYFQQLQRWKRRYRLSLGPALPTYASPILIYLPRGENAA